MKHGVRMLLLLVAALTVQVQAQLQSELSPAVSFYCSNTILRVWHMSKSDWAPMSDDELENLRANLAETCQPKEGWNIQDGFYRNGAIASVLSELLLRTRLNYTKQLEEDTETIHTLTTQRDQALEENRVLKARLKKNTKAQ